MQSVDGNVSSRANTEMAKCYLGSAMKMVTCSPEATVDLLQVLLVGMR